MILKRIAAALLLALFLYALVIFISNMFSWKVPPGRYEQALAKLLENRKGQDPLSLVELFPGEWDELTVWKPYGNICDLGIEGFDRGSTNCVSTVDDSDCRLLFLNGNHLVELVRMDRRKIDLAASHLPRRISRPNAIFYFLSQVPWPKVRLINP